MADAAARRHARRDSRAGAGPAARDAHRARLLPGRDCLRSALDVLSRRSAMANVCLAGGVLLRLAGHAAADPARRADLPGRGGAGERAAAVVAVALRAL